MAENESMNSQEKKPKRAAKKQIQEAQAEDTKQNAAENTEAQAEPAKEKKQAKAKKEARQASNSGAALFGKYPYSEVNVEDESLAAYINLSPKSYPMNFGRRNKVNFYETTNIIERFMSKLMRGGTGRKIGGKVIRTEGRLQGKKLKIMKVVEKAFEIVNKQTEQNPIQVFVDALEFAAPIEDTTRVRYGGIAYNVAVDLSSVRRLNIALKNLALAAITGAFKSRKSLADALANEIMLAAKNDANSYVIKKRIESERMARSAR